ncbi:hypothetical protein [Streptomyces sp. NPDC046727]|uniref:hypothetical protein n=1 Tax=Streptomyces sp. NPDC046727 TaxID=3155373 RepID=UPI0033F3156D
MTHPAKPTSRHTLDEWLARARTKDRYDTYDLTAARARLMRRRDLRHRLVCPLHGGEGIGPTEAATIVPFELAWTAPGARTTADIGRADADLRAVSLLVLLSPGAEQDLAAFIDHHYAHQAGARTFACMLHLWGHGEGARFWWQFAAGAGDHSSAYCLFLDHARQGEFYDAEHWESQLAVHGFTPEEYLGDRTDAPVLTEDLLTGCVNDYIVERHHPDVGVIPFPKTLLLRHVRRLAGLPTRPCAT